MSSLEFRVLVFVIVVAVVLLGWIAWIIAQPLPGEEDPEQYGADDDFDPTKGER